MCLPIPQTTNKQGSKISPIPVEKTMTTEGPRRIESLQAQISLPVSLSQEQKALLKRVANDCPVKRNLDASITIDLIWSDASSTAL